MKAIDVVIDGIRYIPEPQKLETAQTIGDFLHQHRKRLRLSLKVAAARIGISISHLHGLENGAVPGFALAVRLGDFYGFSLDDMARCARLS